MINESIYNKTISILVDAYFNDKLISQDCTACAVGNIISACNGYERIELDNKELWITKDGQYLKPKWINVFGTPKKSSFFGIRFLKKQYFNEDNINSYTIREIEKTGYKTHELALIENAFEKGYKGKDKMFNALMSVVDCLDRIHKNEDVSIIENSKSLFKSKILANETNN